jgi:hypothetical protein
MAGMFNSPCCGTCVHELASVAGNRERVVCQLHRKQLPVWLREWKVELVLCSSWRHYNSTDKSETLRAVFHDDSALYSYPNEYSGDRRRLIGLAELPDAA